MKSHPDSALFIQETATLKQGSSCNIWAMTRSRRVLLSALRGPGVMSGLKLLVFVSLHAHERLVFLPSLMGMYMWYMCRQEPLEPFAIGWGWSRVGVAGPQTEYSSSHGVPRSCAKGPDEDD